MTNLLLLLLSHFSRVRPCATPQTAAHQAARPLSPGFSRQEHWSGLPFPPPKDESEKSEVAQSCLALCDPMDCSPPGSCVHGIFQARVLEWGAIAFSKISPYYHFTHIYSYSYLFSVPSSLLPPADISVTTWHTCTYLHVMCSLPPMLECKLHIP